MHYYFQIISSRFHFNIFTFFTETSQQDLTESVSVFMAYVLSSVNEISQAYLANEKRFNYTTPKSFLELIELYSKLLNEKTVDNIQRINRLENGLVRLAQCAEQVDSLKVKLKQKCNKTQWAIISTTKLYNSVCAGGTRSQP